MGGRGKQKMEGKLTQNSREQKQRSIRTTYKRGIRPVKHRSKTMGKRRNKKERKKERNY